MLNPPPNRPQTKVYMYSIACEEVSPQKTKMAIICPTVVTRIATLTWKRSTSNPTSMAPKQAVKFTRASPRGPAKDGSLSKVSESLDPIKNPQGNRQSDASSWSSHVDQYTYPIDKPKEGIHRAGRKEPKYCMMARASRTQNDGLRKKVKMTGRNAFELVMGSRPFTKKRHGVRPSAYQ